MGRMHSKGKGISSSALPYKKSPPSWLKITTQEVGNQLRCFRSARIIQEHRGYDAELQHRMQIEEHIVKLSKKGVTPSQIGVTLRDSHGVTQVGFETLG